ncbi:MAG TPA: type ISP restriction/modification enzyme [Solirubrobacterales bacterium]|nr:type ISP restriction/modification enzyme [Solirubrobacterales bacterium]
MSLREILEAFAESTTAAYSVAEAAHSQPEDQLKSPIVILIGGLGDLIGSKAIATTESAMPDLEGRPDVAVTVAGTVCGHIELKAPGKGARVSKLKGADAKQWKKFRDHPNLIYTDGNEWALYRSGELVGKLVKLAGDVTTDGAKAVSEANATDLEALLRDFTSWEPLVPTSPKRLADTLAPLCRLLRDAALAAVQLEGSAMHLLAEEWRHYLFADADDQQFADAYAQTVTYALLLARVEGAENLKASAADRLDERHGLLAQVLRILAQRESRAEVEVPIDLLERTIGAVDASMMSTDGNTDPWLYFYEDFLAAYDPKLRNNRGVYYTPGQVVQAQVRLVTELLHDRFGKSLGIVDDGVVVLDPAAGTGTYLLAAIDEGLTEAISRFGPGEAAGRATTAASNFHGFEILVGPYAVAHLRVAQRILERGGSLPENGVQVYLADTLESPFVPGGGKQTSLTHKKLSEESERARRVKAEERVLVCIGNPPYDRQQIDPEDEGTERKGGWVRFGGDGEEPILNSFIEPVREAGAGGQLKNLYNDYVYFWRWALWKVFEQSGEGGIVSFITASSYLRGPAFAGMRRVMRETFDELWIIDLGGDNLGARKSENVFAIRTPVAIAIGVRAEEANDQKPAIVRYCGDLVAGPRASKLEQLAAIESLSSLDWEGCFADWDAPLLPEREGDYFAWPLLTDLFPWQQSGIKVGRTWPLSPSDETLEQRWKALSAAAPSERKQLFKDSPTGRKVDSGATALPPETGRLPALKDVPSDEPFPGLTPVAYRSLDRQRLIHDPRLIDRPGPPLWNSFSSDQVFLTSLLTGVLGEGPAAVAAAQIPDLDHFRGSFGAKHVVPLWRDSEGKEPNLVQGLLEGLGQQLGKEVAPEDFFAYVYAVLSADYTTRFATELEVPGPRIPITKDPELMAQATELGGRLIWLHTYGERFLPPGEKFGQIPPGNAKCTVAVPTDKDHYPETFTYEEETQRLRVGDGVFEPVSPEVWNFSVSGLQVVRSWLSYRMKEGAGKRSSPLDDIRPENWPADFTEELCCLLWILEQTVALTPELSDLLDRIVEGSVFTADELPAPTAEERAAPKPQTEAEEQLSLE